MGIQTRATAVGLSDRGARARVGRARAPVARRVQTFQYLDIIQAAEPEASQCDATHTTASRGLARRGLPPPRDGRRPTADRTERRHGHGHAAAHSHTARHYPRARGGRSLRGCLDPPNFFGGAKVITPALLLLLGDLARSRSWLSSPSASPSLPSLQADRCMCNASSSPPLSSPCRLEDLRFSFSASRGLRWRSPLRALFDLCCLRLLDRSALGLNCGHSQHSRHTQHNSNPTPSTPSPMRVKSDNCSIAVRGVHLAASVVARRARSAGASSERRGGRLRLLLRNCINDTRPTLTPS